jgi:hypothetical protein
MPKLSVKMSILGRVPAGNEEEETEEEEDDDSEKEGAERKRHRAAAASNNAPNFISALLHAGRRPWVRDEME